MAIEELSLEDKGFMISHPQDFPRETKTMIYMNENQWMDQLESQGKGLFVKTKKFETLNNINEFLEKYYTDSIAKKKVSDIIMTLYNMPAGTYKDLGMFLTEAINLIVAESETDFNKELQLERLLIKDIFFNKLNANDICIRLEDSVFDKPKIYSNALPILLVDQIVSIRNEKVVATLIYLLFKVCQVNALEKPILFARAISNIYSIDANVMVDTINLIDNQGTDEVRLLSSIDSLEGYDIAKNLARNVIANNKDSFFNDRSIYTKNDMSVISNAKTDDALYFQVNDLIRGKIRDYFEDDDVIEYNGFSESDIGYLTKKEGFTIGKIYIYNSNWGMLTIASRDSTDYLLFRLNGKPAIYGISIQEDKDRQRKMLEIDIPDDPLFQLQSNGLISI